MIMPSYYDEKQKTWYCKFYYTDWTGQRKQKLKRGFTRQRDAKDWERNFLERQQGSPDMTFQALYDLYMEDIAHRLKYSTIRNKKGACGRHIVPYFKEKPINEITPADIRQWQSKILSSPLKDTYQRQIYNQLNAVLNFAVRYYGLFRNPCSIAGPIGKARASRMDFWTLDEFNRFIGQIKSPHLYAAFMTLYYTGMRCGELFALNLEDVDLNTGAIHISKTYHRVNRQDVITTPKTENSVRNITIPQFLTDCLSDYAGRIYGMEPGNRLFQTTQSKLITAMRKYSTLAGIKRIRIHDIRHSHVSLLIDMGFSPLLIAERIGDTVDMVNNIYGHLYPNRHNEVADKLQQLVSK
ncbi:MULTISPECIES: site-specific integrase [Clostridium]|uniref:site-specific integrase n=1 Tax=Clostridium TaxID=1485 RepID=UPI0025848646|nr:site-specific integrase [Clostridium sp.]MCI6140429.1 site-specific integrase [Clostridium sp.]